MSTSSHDSKTRLTFQTNTSLSEEDVRRATVDDAENFEQLIDDQTQLLFGKVDCKKLIDTCFLSVCLRDEEGLIAFMCLHDRPNIPSILASDWVPWIRNLYNLKASIPYNTLWIHMVGWDKRYTYTFLPPILKFVFGTCPSMEHILIVIPPGTSSITWLGGQGIRLIPPGFYDASKVQTLFLMLRQNFVTKFKIRRAVEEDNDDLVPLLYANTDRLQNSYGEFYIAEMITKHPDSGRQLIVAECNERAVAVLCLNETINDTLLNREFELVPFYGLRKPHPDDEMYDLTHPCNKMGVALVDDDREDSSFSTLVPHEEDLSEKESTQEITDSEQSEDSEDDFLIINVSSVNFTEGDHSEESTDSMGMGSDSYSEMMQFDYEMHLFANRKTEARIDFDVEYRLTDLTHLKSKPAPVYYGNTNAFTLELAVSHPSHETEAIPLLLQAAFECFPDRDYCVLSIPSTCPPFPMLNSFVRVAPHPISTYPHELYILHRNAVLSTLQVRPAIVPDIDEVQELLESIPMAHTVIDSFLSAICEEEDFESYLLSSENKIVGVAMIRHETDSDYLRNHYSVDQWITDEHHRKDEHALLVHLVLSPIFLRHSRFFLREILRLSDYTVLYHYVYTANVSNLTRDRPLCGVLDYLIPMKPRELPEFPNTSLDDECNVDELVTEMKSPFTLYLATTNLCTLNYFEINTKIVVVGSSDTALAFLKALIHGSTSTYRANFSNVTIVSPHGLTYQRKREIANILFVRRSSFNYQHMQMDTLKTYVNEIKGVLTKIDRKNKFIVINEKHSLSYDLLFLMCGKQFQKPILQSDKKQSVTRLPENLFLINTEIDAMHALGQMRRFKKSDYVIIYGYALEAFCCITTLIKYGVSPDCIKFVEPFPIRSPDKTLDHVVQFYDPDVDEAVRSAIKKEGVIYYSSYYFIDWIIENDNNIITSVKFESHLRRINVTCRALFMYNDKQVGASTFTAISSAGLVFDGALVIGPDCKTNDPFIYAAGTVTKYSRRYYADDLAHQFFNVEEIGTKLGQSIRAKLIPNCAEVECDEMYSCPTGNLLVPHYEKPLVTFCHLPGELQYLSVTKPGRQIPLEVAMASDDYGEVFVTGNCHELEKHGYFRLHLNHHGAVETITCLTTFDIDITNIIRLWGKHEMLLNNLKKRFKTGLIKDLYAYFNEPWTSAIYHDRYPILETLLHEILTRLTDVPGESPIEDFLKMFQSNEWRKLDPSQNEEVEQKFANSTYKNMVEEQVLKFIHENQSFLPMYVYPSYIRRWLRQFKTSPLFHEQ